MTRKKRARRARLEAEKYAGQFPHENKPTQYYDPTAPVLLTPIIFKTRSEIAELYNESRGAG